MKPKRRQYLVDRGFQFKYTAGILLVPIIMVIIIAMLTFMYNNLISEILTGTIRSLGGDPDLSLKQLSEQNYQSLMKIIVFSIVMAIGLFLIGIYSSHKLVGPVVRFKKTLSEIQEGRIPPKIKLRKGDLGADMADAINRLIDANSAFHNDPAQFLAVFERVYAGLGEGEKENLKNELEIILKR